MAKPKTADVKLTITSQEHATVLAALRFYQARGQDDHTNRTPSIHDIATNGGQVNSLDDQGIENLCEKINTQ